MKTDYSISNSRRNASNFEVSPFWMIEKYYKYLANIVLKYLAWNLLQNFHVSTRYVKTFQQDLLKYFNKIWFNISTRFVGIFHQICLNISTNMVYLARKRLQVLHVLRRKTSKHVKKRASLSTRLTAPSFVIHLGMMPDLCKSFFLFLGNILFPKIILQPHSYNPSGVLYWVENIG